MMVIKITYTLHILHIIHITYYKVQTKLKSEKSCKIDLLTVHVNLVKEPK